MRCCALAVLRALLRQRGAAVHAAEDARWHVVLRTCAELLEEGDLGAFGAALLHSEAASVVLGPGANGPGVLALSPFLAAAHWGAGGGERWDRCHTQDVTNSSPDCTAEHLQNVSNY